MKFKPYKQSIMLYKKEHHIGAYRKTMWQLADQMLQLTQGRNRFAATQV
jgi:hypothetical protein